MVPSTGAIHLGSKRSAPPPSVGAVVPPPPRRRIRFLLPAATAHRHSLVAPPLSTAAAPSAALCGSPTSTPSAATTATGGRDQRLIASAAVPSTTPGGGGHHVVGPSLALLPFGVASVYPAAFPSVVVASQAGGWYPSSVPPVASTVVADGAVTSRPHDNRHNWDSRGVMAEAYGSSRLTATTTNAAAVLPWGRAAVGLVMAPHCASGGCTTASNLSFASSCGAAPPSCSSFHTAEGCDMDARDCCCFVDVTRNGEVVDELQAASTAPIDASTCVTPPWRTPRSAGIARDDVADEVTQQRSAAAVAAAAASGRTTSSLRGSVSTHSLDGGATAGGADDWSIIGSSAALSPAGQPRSQQSPVAAARSFGCSSAGTTTTTGVDVTPVSGRDRGAERGGGGQEADDNDGDTCRAGTMRHVSVGLDAGSLLSVDSYDTLGSCPARKPPPASVHRPPPNAQRPSWQGSGVGGSRNSNGSTHDTSSVAVSSVAKSGDDGCAGGGDEGYRRGVDDSRDTASVASGSVGGWSMASMSSTPKRAPARPAATSARTVVRGVRGTASAVVAAAASMPYEEEAIHRSRTKDGVFTVPPRSTTMGAGGCGRGDEAAGAVAATRPAPSSSDPSRASWGLRVLQAHATPVIGPSGFYDELSISDAHVRHEELTRKKNGGPPPPATCQPNHDDDDDEFPSRCCVKLPRRRSGHRPPPALPSYVITPPRQDSHRQPRPLDQHLLFLAGMGGGPWQPVTAPIVKGLNFIMDKVHDAVAHAMSGHSVAGGVEDSPVDHLHDDDDDVLGSTRSDEESEAMRYRMEDGGRGVGPLTSEADGITDQRRGIIRGALAFRGLGCATVPIGGALLGADDDDDRDGSGAARSTVIEPA